MTLIFVSNSPRYSGKIQDSKVLLVTYIYKKCSEMKSGSACRDWATFMILSIK